MIEIMDSIEKINLCPFAGYKFFSQARMCCTCSTEILDGMFLNINYTRALMLHHAALGCT